MTTQEYLAAIRAKLGITSDYATAKALGVSKQSVSRWSKGPGGFDDDVSRRVADILEIHPGIVILDMHVERAGNAANRNIWQEIAAGFPALLLHAKTGRSTSLSR